MKEINKNDWKYYLTRPFNLFEASIWHEWYCSDLMYQLVGMKLKHGLYIEYPSGNARSYRRPDEIDKFMKLAGETGLDRERAMKILSDATKLNKEAVRLLDREIVLSFEDALEFLNKMVIYAILPYYIGNARFSDSEISGIVNQLRSVSYYPRVLKEIIIPQAIEKLAALGYKDSDIINVSTIKELFSGKIDPSRLSHRKHGTYFVYQNNDGVEDISWVDDVGTIVDRLDGVKTEDVKEILGTVASKGIATGKVRIVQGNDVSKIVFDKGDILVSASTNPSLISIIQKAGAIVTDEGGLMSHAAILSRELNIPCVIATRNATRVLKDGDMVRVDAENGVVIKI